MDTVYAVCEIGYEYDDERYAQTNNCDASTPTGKAYRSKEKAEAEAIKLNNKKLREIELPEYTDDIEDLFSHYDGRMGRVRHDFAEYGFVDVEDVAEYIAKATDDDLAKLAKLMDIKFYEVREIKLID